ncbi:MAG TPA: glycosyltransferase family 4 protein [Candidatus Cloacimonadota bacterium]|nr:glycosyltransferase family 4 protein [Candidatus Cloacimonadota bacterium]HPT71893.1 glycosyltransferase family 4 protein [Candidatus Cloacimonadota bacterium]
MNILYLNTKRKWNGISTWMVRSARGLEKKGHKVIVLSDKNSRFVDYNPDGVKIQTFRAGIDFNPLAIAYVLWFIRKHKIDIIITNTEKEVSIGGNAARLAHIPNIRLINVYTDLEDKPEIQYLHRFVTHYIITSKTIYNDAKNRYKWVDADDFTIIHNGVRLVSFSAEDKVRMKRKWGLTENDFVIGITSQITRTKGIGDLVQAFSQISADYPNLYLVICGDGPQESEMKDLVWQMQIVKKVIFLDFQRNPMECDQAYDIGILPSYVEGFPNTILEYFSVGLPVIASSIAGVPEMITHGENGFLITPGDIKSLTHYILQLINDAELRTRMGQNAREHLREHFTDDVMVNDLEKLFNNLIAHRKG